MFALQWHQDGLTPYMVFEGRRDHGDAEIQSGQDWLEKHFGVANPVEETIKRSRLAERTFKRRFTVATGVTPLEYVQRLRVEHAKRRLERTDTPIENQLASRLRRSGVLPPLVQAGHRHVSRRLPQALLRPRFCAHVRGLRPPATDQSRIRER